MGYCTVKILSNLESDQVEALKRNREETIEALISNLTDGASDYWSNAIDYFYELDDMDSLLFGCERPDELIAEVKEWNQPIVDGAVAKLNILRDRTLEELEKIDYSNPNPNLISSPTNNLRKTLTALAALNGDFMYGNDRMVFVEMTDDEDDTAIIEYGTMISPDLLEDVEQHPERYFIVELDYT